MNAKTNLVGKSFGRWTVTAFSHTKPARAGNRYYWNCRCECGKERIVRSDLLTRGGSASCGCSHKTHGKRYTSEYRIWGGIKSRCHNPRVPEFKDYGGRGISMCREWRDSFVAFLRDVGPRPSPDHEIDRRDNDGNYEPGNVRWATRLTQARNTRANRRFDIDGQSLTLSEVSERCGIRADTIAHRLRNGMSIEDAMRTPVLAANSHRKRQTA